MFSDGYIGDTYFDVELLMIPDVVLCRLAKETRMQLLENLIAILT